MLKRIPLVLASALLVVGCADTATQPEAEQDAGTPLFGTIGNDPADGLADASITSKAFDGSQNGAPANEANFTPPLPDWLGGPNVVQGTIVHVGRGCPAPDVTPEDPYLADPAGKIALIERGGCRFDAKILRAEQAGAIAAIVYDDAAGGRILMAGDPIVSIPGVFVTQSDGLTLAVEPLKGKIQAASFKSLREAVDALVDDGTLGKKQAKPLRNYATDAGEAAESGDFATARDLMIAFQNEVLALYNGGTGDLPLVDASTLFNAASTLIGKLFPLAAALTS